MDVPFPINSLEQLTRLISTKIEEGPSLEYKEVLALSTRGDRKEALKDLSGMGNSGAGTIIFGVAEDQQNSGVPDRLTPLSDRADLGRLEDIARDGIRPPLLFDFRRVESDGGYVLIADVWRSPLGPYMVEGYDERRYHIRIGLSTVPMTEQQVRDAYQIAGRWQDRRVEVWREHRLPVQLDPGPSVPWLDVAAIPEAPLREVLRLPVDSSRFTPPPVIEPATRLGGVHAIRNAIRIWADGVYGDVGRFSFRFHRDGAVGLTSQLDKFIQPIALARMLNGQLMYLAWLWTDLGVRTPVEIKVQFQNLGAATQLYPGALEAPTLQRPAGIVSVSTVGLSAILTPWELKRANPRHVLVRDLADRLHQAFGIPVAPPAIFLEGWLYGQDGSTVGVGLWDGALCGRNGDVLARVYDDGHVGRVRDGAMVAYAVDGVILDLHGNALAAVEMATGSGLPHDFIPQSHSDTTALRRLALNKAEKPLIPPASTREWSKQSLQTIL